MNAHDFVIAVCILTVLGHIGLLFTRGWLIGELRREQNKMKSAWSDFKQDQAKWKKDFEDEHRAPWNIKKRTA